MTLSTIIEGPDGHFGAYIARPSEPNGAALVVIQEIFGVNQVMRDLADGYASMGYLTIVPDLFWRIEPGISISDKTPQEMAQAFDLFGKFDIATGIIDIQATLNFARISAPKVGLVGYCLGGLLAYLSACTTDSDASVSYYGVSIEKYAAQATSISQPLLLHVAAQDAFVGKDAQDVIGALARANPAIALHVYQGLDHAFARPGGDHFDVAGASLANARTADFFKAHLS
jgi:carboxymethylenebutenolidase